MSPSFGTACLLAAVCSLPPSGAGAQEALPPEVVRVEGRLSDAQAAQVRGFVDEGLRTFLAAGDAEAVGEARQRLTSPLSAIGVTPSFTQQYGRELAGRVRDLPPDTDNGKRINALLLLRTAPAREALQAVQPSLRDGNASVRFTAAKVILDLLNRGDDGGPPAGADLRNQLGDTLAEAAAAETDAFVVGKLLPALEAARGDAGRGGVIRILNARVAVHAAEPGTGYLPELAQMRGLFLKNLGRFERAEAAALCGAAARYLKLISRQFADGVLPAEKAGTAEQLLLQSDNILRELSVSQLGLPASGSPRSVAGSVEEDDHAAVSAAADRWLELLAGPGTGLTASDLDVPEAAAAEG